MLPRAVQLVMAMAKYAAPNRLKINNVGASNSSIWEISSGKKVNKTPRIPRKEALRVTINFAFIMSFLISHSIRGFITRRLLENSGAMIF